MRIVSYKCTDYQPPGWSFSEVELGRINLIVGDTASGKTRFLNTILNLAASIAPKKPFGQLVPLVPLGGEVILRGPSQWIIQFDHLGISYKWDVKTTKLPNGHIGVAKEHLQRLIDSSWYTIVKRTKSSFYFNSSKTDKLLKLPKLPTDTLSLTILKEEDIIKPLYEAFSTMILRRNFFSDAFQALIPSNEPKPGFLNKPPETLYSADIISLPINLKLCLLERHFASLFKQLCANFRSVFPFITSISIRDFADLYPVSKLPGPIPVFCIKEKGLTGWIGADQLSSGMQKVLLILTDIFTLPDGAIYVIDEYENSLGIAAIDFFPPLLDTYEKDIQYIITSHHPYLISSIPASDWLVFHREGTKVKIRYGKDNVEAYGKSKQERFHKLLNDPFYTSGAE